MNILQTQSPIYRSISFHIFPIYVKNYTPCSSSHDLYVKRADLYFLNITLNEISYDDFFVCFLFGFAIFIFHIEFIWSTIACVIPLSFLSVLNVHINLLSPPTKSYLCPGSPFLELSSSQNSTICGWLPAPSWAPVES